MSVSALDGFMSRLRDRQLVVRDRLLAHGYRFCDVASGRELEAPVGTPDLNALRDVQQALRECGVGIPNALFAFWKIVGWLEFQGVAPLSWTGCDYADPISIVRPDLQSMSGELERWLERGPDEGAFPEEPSSFSFQVAGDHIHKAGYSGGGYFILFDQEDPRFLGERFDTRFTTYLRICTDWAGFPGLAHCPHHRWPLARLIEGVPPLEAF